MSVDPSSPVNIFCVFFLSFEACVSIFTNIFITSVILCDYHLKRSLTSVQRIQAALNVSSTFFIIVSSFNVFSHLMLLEFSSSFHYNVGFVLVFVYCICSSSMLTSVLCFYYFIKVVNVQRGLFGWVKKKIHSVVPWLIVLGKLFPLLNSLFSLNLFTFNPFPPLNGSFIPPVPVTLEQNTLNYNIIKVIFIMIFFPLLSTVITTLLTVVFLKLHSRKMKNSQTSGEASLAMYRQVVCKMMRFLILYSVFYLVIFLYYFSVFSPYSPGYYINLMLMFLFTPIQSVLHILDNRYLRSAWKAMIGWLIRSTHRHA